MPRMTPQQQYQHLQAHQATAAPKRASANQIEQGYHLRLPNLGKEQEGTCSARSVHNIKNGNCATELLPPPGQPSRAKVT